MTTTETKNPTNHVLHFIMTLLTGGLWLPVWVIVYAINQPKESYQPKES